MKNIKNRIAFWIVLVIFGSVLLIFSVIYCRNNYFKMYDKLIINEKAKIHFSVDDSNGIFEDLTVNADSYTSIFDQPVLHQAKLLHERYDIKVSFYVFYSWDSEADTFALSNCTDQFADEFSEHADWLRFGYHAYSPDLYDSIHGAELVEVFQKTVSELIRITGSVEAIDEFVRLERFAGQADDILLLSKTDNGIVGLLSADDDRLSYDLTAEGALALKQADWWVAPNGLVYTPTDIRIENIENDKEFYAAISSIADQEYISIFTHEWALADEKVQKYFSRFAEFACENNIQSLFFEDIVNGDCYDK